MLFIVYTILYVTVFIGKTFGNHGDSKEHNSHRQPECLHLNAVGDIGERAGVHLHLAVTMTALLDAIANRRQEIIFRNVAAAKLSRKRVSE